MWLMDFMYLYETKKPLAIALSGVVIGQRERDYGGNITNVQYKPNRNCHYESPR
jgi:hypothetical protein